MTTPLSDAELAHLAAVTEAATPGKRVRIGNMIGEQETGLALVAMLDGSDTNAEPIELHSPDWDRQMANAAHIAAFDVPTCQRLLDHIAALEAERDKFRAEVHRLHDDALGDLDDKDPYD